ncbi:MAG: four helix bundle protein [Lewinella sp.]|nr:four helix bundle protein [Lewinella sp.]
MTTEKFEFEDLLVWEKAVDFADLVLDKMERLDTTRKHYRIVEQMEAACTSIAMNIAEGKGRHFDKEYLQFLYYARGSMYETITLLKIINRRRWIQDHDYYLIRSQALDIGRMLNALIRAIRKRVPKK